MRIATISYLFLKRTITAIGMLSIILLPTAYLEAAPRYSLGHPKHPLSKHSSIELGRGFHAISFSKAFGKRFGLEVADSVAQSKGLYAMEWSIEPALNSPLLYQCFVNLYVDSDLDIFYPSSDRQGSVGDIRQARSILRIRKRIDKISLAKASRHYRLKAVIGGQVGQGRDAYAEVSLPIDSYRIELFQGISFIRLGGFSCSDLPSSGERAEIWVEKKSGPDYSEFAGGGFKADHFYRFVIPKSLRQSVCPYAYEASRLYQLAQVNTIVSMKNWYAEGKLGKPRPHCE